MSKPTGKYQIWFNYGCEGWQPSLGFDTAQEALDHLMKEGSYGNEFVITKIIKFVPEEEKEDY